MKQLSNFIQEKLHISNYKKEFNIKELLDNIDINNYKWSEHGIGDKGLEKCKDTVKKFATEELYKDIESYARIFNLFKDSYRKYLDTNNWSEKRKDDYYNEQIKKMIKYGWAQFEDFCLEQGWWHFIDWVIKENNL